MSDECGHCGRTDTVMGTQSWSRNQVALCHANRDGTKADPDCYHLVTTGAELLGQRKLDR
jgi:hypothetical protein